MCQSGKKHVFSVECEWFLGNWVNPQNSIWASDEEKKEIDETDISLFMEVHSDFEAPLWFLLEQKIVQV